MLIRHRGRWLLAILATDVVVAATAPTLGDIFGGSSFASGAVAAVAVLTFLGLYGLSMRNDASPSADDMRTVIAATIVMVYLVLIGLVAFYQGFSTATLNPLTNTLVTNFTVVTGIVIAFYFGSGVVVAVADRRRPRSGEEKEQVGSAPAPEPAKQD